MIYKWHLLLSQTLHTFMMEIEMFILTAVAVALPYNRLNNSPVNSPCPSNKTNIEA
jgi:hypothetical protein